MQESHDGCRASANAKIRSLCGGISLDGISWKTTPALEINAASPRFQGSNIPAFGGGNWVAWKAVAGEARPYTSPDSVNWSIQTKIPANVLSTGTFSIDIPSNADMAPSTQELSFVNGKFFGFISTKGQGSTKNVAPFYSVDGAAWSQGVVKGLVYVDGWAGATARADLCEVRGIASGFSGGGLKSIAVGRGVFGNLTTSPIITDKGLISTDQITWNATTLPFKALWNGIAHGNGCFVAVGKSFYGALTSDGVTWNTIQMPATLNWTSIAYGNGKWIAVGGPSSIAAVGTISGNSMIWREIDLPSSAIWSSIAYGNGKFVITNTNGGSIYSVGY